MNFPDRRRLMVRSVVGVVVTTLVIGVLLFAAAGTLYWPRGWVLLAIFFAGSCIATVDLFRTNPALLTERLKAPIQKAQPLADKLVLSTMIAGFVVTLVLAPLDVFRLHLLPQPGQVLAIFGLAAFVAGWWITYGAMRQNAFAAPVVKLQEDRGQRVIDTGPYAIVRHPMYAGALVLMLAAPIALGSLAGLAAFALLATAIVLRLLDEERVLARELAGYDAYREKTRWRLVPGVF